jgi:predicted kinase
VITVAQIHLVEGPVGAGKSTFGRQLSERLPASHLALDHWMSRHFKPGQQNPRTTAGYLARKEQCIDQIWNVACETIDSGSDVILELGLIQRNDRSQFFRRVESAGYDLNIYILNASPEVRRERVQERNRIRGETFSMVVPDHIFDMANKMWEPFDEDEYFGSDVQYISTDN